jgi:dihydrofolate synthase/folylpolyglutamate synthase
MFGRHQVNNLATALTALLELVPISVRKLPGLGRGLSSVSLVGRLQQLSDHPRVYVDVGHNALAAQAILEALKKMTGRDAELVCHCVFGMLADKDAAAVAHVLEPLVSSWYCAGLSGERGQTGDELATKIRAVAANAKVISCADVDSALNAALCDLSRERPSPSCILVFGSFLTAGQAITGWQSARPGAFI